ncbi:MAG TPA: radical SAM protein [Thermoanaerobaculia bacterium]|nr:radical SAM protein [Thermoanaerobaculia bacterium]
MRRRQLFLFVLLLLVSLRLPAAAVEPRPVIGRGPPLRSLFEVFAMALDVYLTNACNLRCKYCFNLDREDAPRVPVDDICAILKAAYEKQNRYVSITGGEPFLYKPIFEVLDYAHDLGYWINVLSHGGLLDQPKIDRLKKYWRLRIRISLDGPDRETHDLLRGEGTFDNTMAKVDLLVENGINVGLGVTVSETNLGAVEEILRLAIEKRVAFIRFVPVARVKKGKAAHVTASLHERLLESLVTLTLKYREAIDLAQGEAAATPASIDLLTTRRCMAGKNFFGITPDKKIVPCPLIADHPDVPSVHFEDALSFAELGRQMDALFAGMKERLGGICGTCEFRAVCYGGCLAEKISFDRPLDAEQPVCTKLILERIGGRFDPADMDRIVRSWVHQLQGSLEASKSHACMRQAPYWNLNFRVYDRWSETAMRFS